MTSRIVTTTYRYKRPPQKRKAVAIDAAVTVPRAKPGNDNRPAPEPAQRPVIITVQPKAASLPPGLLPDTPEEHQRRGDAADALWRELVRRAAGDERD